MSRRAAWLLSMLLPCTAIAFGVQPALPPVSPLLHLRPDIKTKWEERLCSDQRPPTIRELWQADIFDAQLQGHFMTAKKGLQATPELLAKAATILAERTSHNGFYYGSCPQTLTGWAITSPAPGDYLKRADNHSLFLAWSSVRPYCHEAHIDYVAAAAGRARSLMVLTQKDQSRDITIDDTLLADGTISVTCYPQYGKNLGPELWFLAPVKAGPPVQPPSVEYLPKAEDDDISSILPWINDLRATAKLSPLTELAKNRKRHIDTALLAHNVTVHHDISHLQSVQAMLRKSGGIFVGEDRVKGDNLREMAWLLWNSPRHRDLLLSAKADSLAVSRINDKTQSLVVLTFAKYVAGRSNAVE